MNFNRTCLMMVIAAVIFCWPLHAQEGTQFGYVNVADAVMLHPLMKDFDPMPKRFKLSALKNVPETRSQTNRDKIASEVEKVQSSIKKLTADKIKIEDTYLEDLKKLRLEKNPEGETSGKLQEQYNTEKDKIDSAFFRDVGNLNQEIQKMQAQIVQLNRETEYAAHASQEETAQVFSLILDDVYEGVEAVSKFYKIGFVFNSSFEFARISSHFTTPNPMPDFFGKLDQHLQEVEEGKLTMGASLNAWLNNRNDNLVNCDDRRLSSFVLKGGLNMTPAVVDYIYQKHEISKSHRDFIQDYFKKTVSK
ncbi:MAG TPA: hypothetical protein PLM07_05895 [Candidatus Rifleibacterium sp.]|nr:hypothetical protein [Candidatus Rifleibacterium sp.]HPT45412.1 hypothetical protein [Candidatus Rifleibacterium sp.]